MTYYTTVGSPVGQLLLISDGTSLIGMAMENQKHEPTIGVDWIEDEARAPFPETRRQLAAYFAGELEEFDLPLALGGTAFQQRVWAELQRIPYGVAISYGELARRVGNPKASRAVGMANGRNPVGIIVPCHRVIGSTGKLTGYGGGLERKEALLALEGSSR